MDFTAKLMRAIEKNNSLLCVGLDPVESMLPEGPDIYSRLSAWAGDLIAQTADLVCCFKPNMGFFEQFGPKGMRALADILAQVPSDIPIVLDGKRGDIGSTAEAYARGAYTHFHADAVTLSPYLGSDAVKPFLIDPEKTAFILCQTSNPSAVEIQGHGSPPLYAHVAWVAQSWGAEGQIGLVIGATQPQALADAREIAPQAWFLVPGVGAQGGNLALALRAGLRPDGLGMIVPVSRAILHARDPRAAAASLRDEINSVRASVIAKGRSSGEPAASSVPAALSAPTPLPTKTYQALMDGLFESGCLRFGEFTLASGRQSPVYLDLRRLVSFPNVLDMAVEAYIDQLVTLRYDCLAGVPYAALPIAAIAALKLRQPMVYPRKETKTHGTGQMVEGVFEAGQSAVVLEDVITSGGSLLSSVRVLREAGLSVSDAVVLVDRGQGGLATLADEGVHVHAVLRFSEILDYLSNIGKVDPATAERVRAYLRAEP